MTEPICTRCALHKTCRTVRMDPDGVGDIVVLGEAPGADEDALGRPFVGQSGTLLRDMLGSLNIPAERFRFTNAVRCRPPNNKTPGVREVKACLTHLADEFTENPPAHIIAVGNTALNALRAAGLLTVDGTIMALHGKLITEGDYTIFPLIHPAYLLRNPEEADKYNVLNDFEAMVLHGVPEQAATDYTFSDSVDELVAAIASARAVGRVCYDIETSTLHPKEHLGVVATVPPRIITFSLTWRTGQAFGFALTPENTDAALEVLHTQLLEDPAILKIIQHAKYELLWSMAYGRTIRNMADTMLLHWHVDERNGTHGLGKLALNYTDLGFYDREIEQWKKEHKECDPDKLVKDPETGAVIKGSYANIPLEVLLPYNCVDTDAAWRIYELLHAQVTPQQRWIHDTIQIPACYPLAAMELHGVLVDWEYARELDQALPAEIATIEAELRSHPEVQRLEAALVAGGKDGINFNSSAQIARLLFEFLGLPSVYQTDSGKPSTDKHVLAYLAERHPVPRLLKERRSFATLHSTFVAGAFDGARAGRMHTSYGMAHTETGRYNSKSPNLQNIPRDPLIKNMYVPDPGHWLVQVDYSQIELRVMALFSQDETLLNYFREGADIHRMIAAKIHKRAPEEITKEERVNAKRTVFGLCYGQSAVGLAEELGISKAAAEDFLEKFFREFPAVRVWMQKTEEHAHKTGQVETMFGRIRRLPDARIKRREDPLRSRAMRQAINAPIQGTATDILSYKMAELWAAMDAVGYESRMLLTVHDSLVFTVAPHESAHLLPQIMAIMQDMRPFAWATIPITCDMEFGPRWGELQALPVADMRTPLHTLYAPDTALAS